MQHVFSFTLAEAWAFLIYAAGAAAGLYAGGVAISKVITAVKKPKTDQDKRITKLEERVNAMEGFLKKDKLRRKYCRCCRVNGIKKSFILLKMNLLIGQLLTEK